MGLFRKKPSDLESKAGRPRDATHTGREFIEITGYPKKDGEEYVQFLAPLNSGNIIEFPIPRDALRFLPPAKDYVGPLPIPSNQFSEPPKSIGPLPSRGYEVIIEGGEVKEFKIENTVVYRRRGD